MSTPLVYREIKFGTVKMENIFFTVEHSPAFEGVRSSAHRNYIPTWYDILQPSYEGDYAGKG